MPGSITLDELGCQVWTNILYRDECGGDVFNVETDRLNGKGVSLTATCLYTQLNMLHADRRRESHVGGMLVLH